MAIMSTTVHVGPAELDRMSVSVIDRAGAHPMCIVALDGDALRILTERSVSPADLAATFRRLADQFDPVPGPGAVEFNWEPIENVQPGDVVWSDLTHEWLTVAVGGPSATCVRLSAVTGRDLYGRVGEVVRVADADLARRVDDFVESVSESYAERVDAL